MYCNNHTIDTTRYPNAAVWAIMIGSLHVNRSLHINATPVAVPKLPFVFLWGGDACLFGPATVRSLLLSAYKFLVRPRFTGKSAPLHASIISVVNSHDCSLISLGSRIALKSTILILKMAYPGYPGPPY